MTQPTNDPFETAQNATLPPNTLYGEVRADAWFAALIKGQGRVAFDANLHDAGKRVTAIDIFITPLPEHNITNAKATERHMIAESRDWAAIVLPSLKQFGVSVKDLSGKWVKVELAKNGKQYTNAQGDKKDETVFKLLAVYPDEAACRAAYFADGNQDRRGGTTGDDASTTAQPAAASSAGDPDKANAYKFLQVIVKNSLNGATMGEADQKVSTEIGKYPIVSKHFTVASPETQQLILEHFSTVKF